MTPNQITELKQNLAVKEYYVNVLTEHDFFIKLSGNPHAITLMACLLVNPYR